MGVLEDLVGKYGQPDPDTSAAPSVLDSLVGKYGGATNPGVADVEFEEPGYISALASGIPALQNRLSQAHEFSQEANPLAAGFLAPMVAANKGAMALMRKFAPEKVAAYEAARDEDQRRLSGVAQAAMPSDPNIVQEGLASIPQMALSMNPAGPALNLAASIGSAWEEAESRGVEGPVKTLKAMAEGTAIGALESLGVASVLGKVGRLGTPAATAAGRIGQRGVLGALGESSTEALQETASIASELATGREFKGLGAEAGRVGRAAVVGGVIGGPLGTVASAPGEANTASADRILSRRMIRDAELAKKLMTQRANPAEVALASVKTIEESAVEKRREAEIPVVGAELEVADAEDQLAAIKRMEEESIRAMEDEQDLAISREQWDRGDVMDAIEKQYIAEAKERGEAVDWEWLDLNLSRLAEEKMREIAGRTEFASDEPAVGIGPDFDQERFDDIRRALKDEETSAGFAATRREAGRAIDAILSGDPTRLGSPQQFQAERVKAEQVARDRRDRLRAIREGLDVEAAAALRAATTPEAAREGLERLRVRALGAALEAGDADLFERTDAHFRDRLLAFDPGESSAAPIADTPQEVISQLRDATIAAMPRVQKKASGMYEAAASAGRLPVDPATGLPVERGEWVSDRVLEFQANLNEKIRALVEASAAKGGDQTKAAKDAKRELSRLVKKYDIQPHEIGLMAARDRDHQAVVGEGAAWVSDRVGGRRLSELTEAELTNIAGAAGAEGAPLSAIGFVKAELERRIRNVPPYNPRMIGRGDPNLTDEEIRARAGRVGEMMESPVFRGNPKVYKMPNGGLPLLAYRARLAMSRIKEQFQRGAQLQKGKYIAHVGVGIGDATAQLIDARQRNATNAAILKGKTGAETEAAVLQHEMVQSEYLLNEELAAYIKRKREAGVPIGSSPALYLEIGDAYDSNDLSRLDPELQDIVKRRVQEPMRRFSDLAMKMTRNQAEQVAIMEHVGHYMFRDYAIFRDPEAIFRTIDPESVPYKSLFAKLKKQQWGAVYDEMYEKMAGEFRDQGYTETEIDAAVRAKAEEVLHGKIGGLVRAHLNVPTQNVHVAAVVKRAKREYLEERILKDPDLRDIMGQQKHMALAMQMSMGNVVRDTLRFGVMKSMWGEWEKVGLVGDTEAPDRNVKIDRNTLLPPNPDDPDSATRVVYAHPDVVKVVRALEGSDAMVQAINRFIAYGKIGKVANPGSWMQNALSLSQVIPTAGGFGRAASTILRDKAKAAYEAVVISKELGVPGAGVTKAMKREGKGLYRAYNITPKLVDEAAREMVEAGLHTGGEWAHEFEDASRALVVGSKATGRTRSFLSSAAKAAGDWFARPDLVSKVLAYKMHVDDLMYKEGVSSPSTEIRREAAIRAINTTQVPTTTPDIVRNFSRGWMGVLTANFAGFTYQMGRNLAYAYKYGMEDLAQASLLSAESKRQQDPITAAEMRMKSQRYLSAGTDKVLGATASSVMAVGAYKFAARALYSLLTGRDDDEAKKMERHIAALSPYEDRRYSDVTVMDYQKVDGKWYATVAYTGRVDIYDNLKQMFRAVTDSNLDPMQRASTVARLAKNQLAPVSFLAQGFAKLVPFKRAGDEWVADMPSGSDLLAGVRDVGPTVLGTAISAGQMAAEYAATPEAERNITSQAGNRLRGTAVRQITGVSVGVEPVTDNVGRMFASEWKKATWINDFKSEWKAAGRPLDKKMIEAKYVERWGRLMTSMGRIRNNAVATKHNSYQIRSAMDDKASQIPKRLRGRLAFGEAVPLSWYAGSLGGD